MMKKYLLFIGLMFAQSLVSAQLLSGTGDGATYGTALLHAQQALEKEVYLHFYPETAPQGFDALHSSALFGFLLAPESTGDLELIVHKKRDANGRWKVVQTIEKAKVDRVKEKWVAFLHERLSIADKLAARGLEARAFELRLEAWYGNAFLKLFPPEKTVLPQQWQKLVDTPASDSVEIHFYPDSVTFSLPLDAAKKQWMPVAELYGQLISFHQDQDRFTGISKSGTGPDSLLIRWIVHPVRMLLPSPLLSLPELPSITKWHPVKTGRAIPAQKDSISIPEQIRPFVTRKWSASDFSSWINTSRQQGLIAVAGKPDAFADPSKAYVFITDKNLGLLHVLVPEATGFLSLTDGKPYASLQDFSGRSAVWIYFILH